MNFLTVFLQLLFVVIIYSFVILEHQLALYQLD